MPRWKAQPYGLSPDFILPPHNWSVFSECAHLFPWHWYRVSTSRKTLLRLCPALFSMIWKHKQTNYNLFAALNVRRNITTNSFINRFGKEKKVSHLNSKLLTVVKTNATLDFCIGPLTEHFISQFVEICKRYKHKEWYLIHGGPIWGFVIFSAIMFQLWFASRF